MDLLNIFMLGSNNHTRQKSNLYPFFWAGDYERSKRSTHGKTEIGTCRLFNLKWSIAARSEEGLKALSSPPAYNWRPRRNLGIASGIIRKEIPVGSIAFLYRHWRISHWRTAIIRCFHRKSSDAKQVPYEMKIVKTGLRSSTGFTATTKYFVRICRLTPLLQNKHLSERSMAGGIRADSAEHGSPCSSKSKQFPMSFLLTETLIGQESWHSHEGV